MAIIALIGLLSLSYVVLAADDSGKRVATGGRSAIQPAVDPVDPLTYDIVAVLRGWLVTPNGVFLISPTTLWRDVSVPDVGYLAFWWDYELDGVFVYGRVLTSELHLGQSETALEQDLDVDITPLITDETLQNAWLLAGGRNAAEAADAFWREAYADEVIDILAGAQQDTGAKEVKRLLTAVEAALTALADGFIDSKTPELSTGVQFPGEPGILRAPCCVHHEDENGCLCCPARSPGGESGDLTRTASVNCCTGGECDDGNPCTVDDICGGHDGGPVNSAGCGGRLNCDDGNPCTGDSCTNSGCVHRRRCRDTNPCTIDRCLGGVCSHIGCSERAPECTIGNCVNGHCQFDPINCDDENECTVDFCIGDECFSNPVGGSCEDDGKFCTNDDCVDGGCPYLPGNEGAICQEDNVFCRKWVCVTGNCTMVPDNEGAICFAEKDPCVKYVCVVGFCDPQDDNEGGACDDDGNECTDDICETGACGHPKQNRRHSLHGRHERVYRRCLSERLVRPSGP